MRDAVAASQPVADAGKLIRRIHSLSKPEAEKPKKAAKPKVAAAPQPAATAALAAAPAEPVVSGAGFWRRPPKRRRVPSARPKLGFRSLAALTESLAAADEVLSPSDALASLEVPDNAALPDISEPEAFAALADSAAVPPSDAPGDVPAEAAVPWAAADESPTTE